MLSNSELEDLGKELNGLSVLQEDEVLDGLLRAGIYAKHRLYTEAADAYRKALSGEPAPVIYVTLGDAYRAASVYQLAYESYSRALALTPKMEACAATEEATPERKSTQEAAREMVANVTQWVNEFQQKRRSETTRAIKTLFTDRTPQTSKA